MRATIAHGEGSQAAADALGDLLQAERDVESSKAALRETFSQQSIDALFQWGTNMGISAAALERWVNAQRQLAGLPPISLPGLPSGGFTSAAPITGGVITEPTEGNPRGGSVVVRGIVQNNYTNITVSDDPAARRYELERRSRDLNRLARETVRN